MAYYIPKTVTGSTCTVSDGAAGIPLESAIVDLPASSPATATFTFGHTAPQYVMYHWVTPGEGGYGGSLDIIKGTGSTKLKHVKVKDLNWTYYTGGTNPIFYANNVSDTIIYSSGDTPNVALEDFTVYNASTRSNLSKYMPDNNISFISSGASVAIRYTAATSKDQMLQALGELDLVYESTETTNFTFTPIEVVMRPGENVFSSSYQNTITYYSKVESEDYYTIRDSTIKDIADAIRTKRETTSPILTEDMADEIMAITTGGGSKTPVTLSFTEIGNDDNKTGTITFTDDYHNYPLIKCKMVNTNNQSEQEIIITPQFIDDAFQYSNNRLNFNFKATDIYAYYGLNNGNWVRGGQRSCCVTKVYGVSSSLNEIEVTNLYRYQSSNSNNRTITFDGSVYDYQYLLIGICDGDTTETQGSPAWIIVGNPGLESFTDFHVYYGYNSSPMLLSMTEHGLTAQNTARFGFFTVDGINFT